MADDRADQVKPWTIKGIPAEARNAAIAAADREKQTLGEWITRAIRSQIQSDRQQTRAPVVVGPAALSTVGPSAVPAGRPAVDLAELERVVTMTAQLAAAGAPPPKAVSRAAHALLKDALSAMKGPTDKPAGPTRRGNSPTTEASPTEEAESPTDKPAGPTEDEDSPTKEEPGLTILVDPKDYEREGLRIERPLRDGETLADEETLRRLREHLDEEGIYPPR